MLDWRKNRLVFGILMGPPTFWLVVFFTIPLIIVWVYSFGGRGPEGQTLIEFSLANYRRALEWIHLGIIWKSIVIATITTVICLLLGFPLALAIAFAPAQYKNILLLLTILPFWTNLLIRTYAWIAVLRERGFLNFGLEWLWQKSDLVLGLIGLPDLLGDFEPLRLLYNQPAVVIALVHVHLPFMVLPIYATLEKLDRSYLEASLDLGASQWRTLFSVTVPLAMPGIATGVLFTFILSLGSFLAPDLLGGTESLMIGNLIAHQFGASRDWAFGSALSFMIMYAAFVVLWLRSTINARSKGVVY